jgi:general secretion pathway protein A
MPLETGWAGYRYCRAGSKAGTVTIEVKGNGDIHHFAEPALRLDDVWEMMNVPISLPALQEQTATSMIFSPFRLHVGMYTSFFGLGEKPFAITPDPRYLFMSERHAEALAHLLYGINEAGGFIQLTGEVGTGKTTVVRSLLERMPGHADVAVILNPQLTPVEFVLTICEELGIFMRDEDVSSIKDLVDILNKRLLEAHSKGRRVVVIVDEAQNLTPETLEQVRLLTNLETASQKLLQIILIGQPELREVLARVELRQLAQRITGRYHLDPLSRAETASYVNHRLRVAGSATGEVFSATALREVHRLSNGIPRIINVICDRALLGAFTQEQHRIGPAMVREAAGEVYGRSFSPPWIKLLIGASGTVAVLGLALGIWQLLPSRAVGEDAAAETTQTAVAPTPAAVEVEPAVSAPPPVAAPTVAEIEPLLKEQPGQTTTETAFAQLFALWGAKFDPAKGRPCNQAQQQGLECVYQQGSWGQLRTLNRPAILTLIDDAGNAHQVAVAGLDAEAAKVRFPDTTRDISIASLSRLWYGDYLILWRPQVAAPRALSAGMQGAGVRWLRNSLNTVHGKPGEDNSSDYYDEELVRMVEEFQRQHRLNVDGIAGVQTQIVLDTLNNAGGAPLLVAQTQDSPGAS